MTRIAVLLLSLSAAAASAQVAVPREMSTDRPDKTESPYSVPAGMWQIEADLLARTIDRGGGVRQTTTAIGAFNLKRGIAESADLQFVIFPHVRQRIGGGKGRSGFGDVTVRLKRNLWGDDGGGTALALMPFVTLPTARAGLGADRVEAGLIVPLAVALTDRLGLGLMTEVDWVSDPDGRGRAVSFINSATIGAALTDRLGAYGEIFAEKTLGAPLVTTFDAGLTFAVTDALQFDAGANIGLSRAADDLTLFLGVSHRF